MDEMFKTSPERYLIHMNTMAEREYAKNPELDREDVRRIIDWIKKQPHLPNLHDFFVILFLQRTNYSVEKAKIRIDNFYTVKSLCPEIFTGRDPSSHELQEAMDILMIAPLPNLTPSGHRIIFIKVMDNDVKKYNFINQIKHLDMLIGSFMIQKEGTNKGYVLIMDQEDVPFEYLSRVDLTVIKKISFYAQKAVALRVHQIHVINPFPFVDKLMKLMNLFFGNKTLKKIHIHNDITSLYEHVPRVLLPKERGGEAGTFKDLHEYHKDIIHSWTDLLILDEQLKADNSKRAAKSITFNEYFGVEGTFKNLQVD